MKELIEDIVMDFNTDLATIYDVFEELISLGIDDEDMLKEVLYDTCSRLATNELYDEKLLEFKGLTQKEAIKRALEYYHSEHNNKMV